jgi:hypothetical protein
MKRTLRDLCATARRAPSEPDFFCRFDKELWKNGPVVP